MSGCARRQKWRQLLQISSKQQPMTTSSKQLRKYDFLSWTHYTHSHNLKTMKIEKKIYWGSACNLILSLLNFFLSCCWYPLLSTLIHFIVRNISFCCSCFCPSCRRQWRPATWRAPSPSKRTSGPSFTTSSARSASFNQLAFRSGIYILAICPNWKTGKNLK